MIYSDSEIATLKRLIVHAPDEGIARISPKRAEELLFDDIVYYPKMLEEHQTYTMLLDSLLGKENVLRAEALLTEALRHGDQSRDEIIDMIIHYEELPKSYLDILKGMFPEDLSYTLITGDVRDQDMIMFDPIPNFIFTRDIAVTVNDHVIITKASKEARYRENLLTRYIFWEHPLFKELKENKKIINLNIPDDFPPSRDGSSVKVEGGDMMVLNSNYLLIGTSERSNEHAFHSIKEDLFDRGVIDNVVQVQIPSDRAFMHIDTLFTQIDYNLMVGYKPIIHDGRASYVTVHNKSGETRIYPSIERFVISEINSNMKFVYSGEGKSPHQEREQWTDACNLLALKPGVAIAYDRNIHTAMAFHRAGYKVREAQSILIDIKDNGLLLRDLEKTIITLPSAELSRARGGSHCMSCPILREKLNI